MNDLETASPGPVTEEVVSDAPVETSVEDALSDIYDRANEEPSSEEPDASTDSEDVAEAETEQPVEEPAPKVEAPTFLPVEFKDFWGDVPETARDAFSTHYKDLSDKMSAAQREVNGLNPIKGALVEAIQANPAIANMQPEQVAGQIPELVRIGQRMNQDPEGTIRALAQQYGVNLGGQPNDPQAQAVQQQNAALRAENEQLKAAMNPENRRQEFRQWSQEEQTMTAVQQFAHTAEHWAEVEAQMPLAIQWAQAKLGDNAVPEAVLKFAYETAVRDLLNKAPEPDVAPEAAPEPDPAKVQEALKAKSVNIQGKPSGKARPKTEDEILADAFDRAQAS